MEVRTLVNILSQIEDTEMHIMLPNGDFVPANFHVTEVGKVSKSFIDCGGTKRELEHCVLQVWRTDEDQDHRLTSSKLIKILSMADEFDIVDLPVVVEYGEGVAGTYFLSNIEVTPKGPLFTLVAKETECLAPDKCGVGGGCCGGGSC